MEEVTITLPGRVYKYIEDFHPDILGLIEALKKSDAFKDDEEVSF